MKKSIISLLTALSVLASFASCNKVSGGSDNLADVTLEVGTLAASKAALDGDGAAVNVNRYIMEIYTANGATRYTRLEQSVPAGTLKAEFTVKLVIGQSYTFLLWADTSDAGADLYYKTSDGLQNVSMIGEYAGNKDERDAFFACETMTVTSAISKEIVLHRPFAQLNIITSDVDDVYQDYMLPQEVSVSFTAKNGFNVLTGEAAGSDTEFAYTAVPYYQGYKADELASARAAADSWTLSMDYIFAPAEESNLTKLTLDVKANGNQMPQKALENVPYRRNYRTNVIGEMLTVDGKYTIVVQPDWDGEKDF